MQDLYSQHVPPTSSTVLFSSTTAKFETFTFQECRIGEKLDWRFLLGAFVGNNWKEERKQTTDRDLILVNFRLKVRKETNL